MTVSTARLGQAAAIAATAAGAIFIAVQINHPPTTLDSVTTTDWMIRSTAKAVMVALALVGITGMYLRQRAEVGILGLLGYLILSTGYFLMFGTEYLAAFALPTAAHTDPAWVGSVVNAAYGGKPATDIGALHTVFALTGAGYVAGGLIFGIATYRAGILNRWAAALLAVGNTGTLALAVLPSSFNRPLAVPTGLALIGLGISLWRDQRRSATYPAADMVSPAQVRPAVSLR